MSLALFFLFSLIVCISFLLWLFVHTINNIIRIIFGVLKFHSFFLFFFPVCVTRCKVPCIRRWVQARVRTGKVAKGNGHASRTPYWERSTTSMPTPRYDGEAGPFPTLSRRYNNALQSTRIFCRFYTILCGGGTNFDNQDSGGKSGEKSGLGPQETGSPGADWVGARLVMAMVEEGYRSQDLDEAPLGLSLPLLEVLHAVRGQAPSDWPAAAQELVGRQDLSALRRMLRLSDGRCGGGVSEDDGTSEGEGEELGGGGYWSGGRISGSASAAGRSLASGGLNQMRGRGGGGGGVGEGSGVSGGGSGVGGSGGEGVDLDGLALVDELSSLRFGRDRRVREACRLLRGSRPVRFHVERSPESSDHDHQQRQQARLLQLALRTLAGPTGRGMLTLGTLAPLLAEPLPIPPLCLAGRIRKPADVVINLDLAAAAVSHDTTTWAEFHNGVAAGLRLQHEWGGMAGAASERGEGGRGGSGGSAVAAGFEIGGVSRTWITYNRPAGGANNAHGGLLMALGLQGHLSSLAMTDVYDYLTLGQESTTVGVLLGMAAARRGSADMSTHKVGRVGTHLYHTLLAEEERGAVFSGGEHSQRVHIHEVSICAATTNNSRNSYLYVVAVMDRGGKSCRDQWMTVSFFCV